MWPFDRNGTFVPLCPADKVNFSRAETLLHKIFQRARACACVLASRSATRHRRCGCHTTSLWQPGQPVTRATAPRSPRPRGHPAAPPARCRRRFGESRVASSSFPHRFLHSFREPGVAVLAAVTRATATRCDDSTHPFREPGVAVPRTRGCCFGGRSEDSAVPFLATVLRTFLESCGDSSTTFPKIVPHMVGYGGLTGGSSAGRWWRRWRSPCTGTRGRSGGLGRGRTRPGPSHRHTSSRSAFASAARGAPLAARR